MKKYVPLVAALYCAHSRDVSAYEVPTHRDLSQYAANNSILAAPGTLEQLGLRGLALDDSRQKFPNSKIFADNLTIIELFRFGAAYEDDRNVLQALNHFFNPVNDQALTLFGKTPGLPSPSWALEDSVDAGWQQPYSYKDARQYFYEALTLPTEAERKRSWGKTFQTLGHVIHHLQDMSQPQHVRNDDHCGEIFCRFPGGLVDLHHPSGYEGWTGKRKLPEVLLSGSRYAPVYSAAESAVLTTPRKFWTTADGNGTNGAGIAQYTNRGFFSARTLGIDSEFPAPENSITGTQTADIEALCQEAQAEGREACPSGVTGKLKFVGSIVNDTLRPALSGENSRALTESLFDEDLKKVNAPPVRSLNRFNYEAAWEFLIPRAVGYSAGLINYFFRGKMEISLPNEGVYGVIDHADPASNTKDSGGFRKIKLKVRNTTHGSLGIEPMSMGQLVLVARFHRNMCYNPSLSGEYGSPGVLWQICRKSESEAVVSSAVAVPADINTQATQVTFDFPTPIPINATDLSLQVVYRGKLGDEPGAVVVATRDISEPHYLYNYARWDQFTYASYYPVLEGTGPYSWEQWCLGGSTPGYPSLAACNEANGMTVQAQYSPTQEPIPGYDPNNPGPLDDPEDSVNEPGKWHKLVYQPPFQPAYKMVAPVGTLTRVAILTEVQPSNTMIWTYEWVDTTHGKAIYQWRWGTPLTTLNQRNPADGTLVPSVRYASARGVYAPTGIAEDLSMGTASPMPELILVPSQINF